MWKSFKVSKLFVGKTLALVVLLISTLSLAGCVPPIRQLASGLSADGFNKGKIVSGFPPLPLYEKSEVLESYGFNGRYGASFIADDKLEKVVKFYNDSLNVLGWETVLKKQSETNFVFEIKNAQNKGEVIVNRAGDGKKTAITMSVESR